MEAFGINKDKTSMGQPGTYFQPVQAAAQPVSARATQSNHEQVVLRSHYHSISHTTHTNTHTHGEKFDA